MAKVNIDNVFYALQDIEIDNIDEIDEYLIYNDHKVFDRSFIVDGQRWFIHIFSNSNITTISLFTTEHKIDIFWNSIVKFQEDFNNNKLDNAGVNGVGQLIHNPSKKIKWLVACVAAGLIVWLLK